MRVRSASDAVYTLVAWLPLLAIVLGVGWVLMMGVRGLEEVSFGSEIFHKNSATANELADPGARQEQLLTDALASGDVDQMSAALDELDRVQRAAAVAPAG